MKGQTGTMHIVGNAYSSGAHDFNSQVCVQFTNGYGYAFSRIPYPFLYTAYFYKQIFRNLWTFRLVFKSLVGYVLTGPPLVKYLS